MTIPELRPYQDKMIADIDAAFAAGYRRPLVVLPTGGGKTIVFAKKIQLEVVRHYKALVIAHRREIIKQTSDKLRDAGVVPGIIMAGFEARPTLDVQVASIQTLFARGIRRETMSMPDVDLFIIDEAHHTVAKTYQRVVDTYPNARLLGFTATPERGDGRGLGNIFDVIIEGPQVAELIELGFLVPTKVYAPYTPDLRGVKTVAGDYVQKQLAENMDKPLLVGDIVEQWLKHGEGRKTVTFASGVGHSVHIRDAFRGAGISAAHIDARTPKDDRDATLAQLASGEITVLSNCMILTEGWDLPQVACCILARPTKSMGLFRQMIGRVLRPAPGKVNAVILDHAGCVFRHGFAEDHIDWTLCPDTKAGRNDDHDRHDDHHVGPRIVECTNCSAMRTAGKPCGHCGFMPEARPKYVATADGDLGLVDRERRVAPQEWTQDQRLDFFAQLTAIAQERAYKPGYAAVKYKEKFGNWPPWPRGFVPPPVEPTPEVRAWVKSRAIAWHKSQAKAQTQARGAV